MFFEDDHGRTVRVLVSDFNDGRAPLVRAGICVTGPGGVGHGLREIERTARPVGFDAETAFGMSRYVFEKAAQLCPLHVAWGDGDKPSVIRLSEESWKLQKLLDDPQQWGLFSWTEMLHERLHSLHRMITNILAKA